MKKNVLILSSSPRRHGNSDLLCDRFLEGAKDAGHNVEKFFLKDKDIDFDSYVELSNLEPILNYVKLNMGVSCLPYISVLSEESLKSINVYRIKEHNINRPLYSAIHKDKYISKPIK